MIDLKIDTRSFVKLSTQIHDMANKQVRFATMRALNAAAFKAKADVTKEITQVFDHPTPWIARSVRYDKATKTGLTAKLYFTDSLSSTGPKPDHVLRAEIAGGQRNLKRFEIALQRKGILPSGMAIIPGSAARLDAYGNMSRSQINQILAWFGAGKGSKRTKQGYFALPHKRGKLLPGIYRGVESARASTVESVMIFVRPPTYRKRFDFYRVARESAFAEFHQKFPIIFEEAMRTAR